MERDPRLRHATAVGLIVVGVVASIETVLLASSAPAFSRFGSTIGAIALESLAGWSLLLAGALVGLTPDGRIRGALLAGTAVGWFVAEWATPAAPALVFTLGLALGSAWPALLAHTTLIWTPTARIGTRRSLLVATAYGTNLVLLGLLPAMTFDPVGARCTQCPTNLLGLANEPALALSITRLGFAIEAAWIVAVVAVVAVGVVSARGTEQRLVARVAVPAVVVLSAVAVGALYSIPRGSLSNDPVDLAAWGVQAAGFVAVAVGVGSVWLRRRRTRHRVARLALELAAAPPTGELAMALGRALDDPSLEVRYPIEDERYIDAAGGPVEPPHGMDVATTVVQRSGTPIAILLHHVDQIADAGRIGEAVETARLALENERLQAQRRWRLGELRESRAQIVAASDGERRRLERDLHDGAQQRILALALDLAVARQRASSDPGSVLGPDDGAALELEVRAALAELRELAHGIVPRSLADDGLGPAIEELTERASIPIDLVALPEERFEPGIEATAYLVVARGTRHLGVRRASVDIRAVDERLYVAVGLDMHAEFDLSVLVELEDRCGALDGTVVHETGPDGRAWLRAEIPCAS
jgi:signal transduction histidine kinase